MKILFLSRSKSPNIGGVEKHLDEISTELVKRGFETKTISEDDIEYPHIKLIGLLYIWYWLFKNRTLIKNSNVIHCHDVFIWYLPFRFLYPNKRVFTTFHGWEGKWPIPLKNILLKRLANKLSFGSISVGHYIEKYYGIKSDFIIYGGHYKVVKQSKINNLIVWVGRLEVDTGLPKFLNWLDDNKGYKVEFLGDGSLKEECQNYGEVLGFVNPTSRIAKAEICVPGGYLSYIDAKEAGCKIITFSDNPLKRDYWKEIELVKSFPSWKQVSDTYINLWSKR